MERLLLIFQPKHSLLEEGIKKRNSNNSNDNRVQIHELSCPSIHRAAMGETFALSGAIFRRAFKVKSTLHFKKLNRDSDTVMRTCTPQRSHCGDSPAYWQKEAAHSGNNRCLATLGPGRGVTVGGAHSAQPPGGL